ncbi:ABC transporter ATP-binding protein [Candidatus Desulfovibrio trichonymphae]|uniref:Lipoprotein releasing system ATP-binding protein n=1 Tax=Candidatus Desulfovibrio trichonymphae TaxID=1725232 RepID=A0A1J1E139_9BACT|nr:ABC transporter ATP-binding protein [Candidatus Desulfovibrio trichonymphae]BAV91595.1 lipoprotein releasing system ATP-binding protein [Candidatus Desulfovibrio trichonymphae]GHU90844.1 lipoprotein-releasing system ATP-binding protein LolD [Deltaproteobacteria bacterium]GHU93575.1 lipoprotein-releasing system ATP-binding protein LolD [Deltaproteobacteria bacterium]GHU98679.1 lipoprotein-releasing system ATP-binding protein LolD [Deltaproteobacteria bacterium]
MAGIYTFADVGKKFADMGEHLEIFKNINLIVEEGEALAVVGASGSGKSTLLHLMGALDTPSSGHVLFDGRDMAGMNRNEKAFFRNKTLGFVFQFHHLLPEFSALENVAMPAVIGGARPADALPEAVTLLEQMGLGERTNSKTSTLSGGERQRVAIARAVFLRPRVLLADEPTGNLDESAGARAGTLLRELNREHNMTLVVVTHNRDLAAGMDRVMELKAGKLQQQEWV